MVTVMKGYESLPLLLPGWLLLVVKIKYNNCGLQQNSAESSHPTSQPSSYCFLILMISVTSVTSVYLFSY